MPKKLGMSVQSVKRDFITNAVDCCTHSEEKYSHILVAGVLWLFSAVAVRLYMLYHEKQPVSFNL